MPYRKRMISYNGKEQCISDWAKELGINKVTLASRLYSGWTAEKALTTPIDKIKSSCAVYKHANSVLREVTSTSKVFSPSGRKANGVVWKQDYDSIDDNFLYPLLKLQRLTSSTTAMQARTNNELPFEGTPPRFKGSDIKAWVEKKGFKIIEKPKSAPQTNAGFNAPAPFKEYKITETSSQKYLCFSRGMVYGACCLFGLLAGFVLSKCV